MTEQESAHPVNSVSQQSQIITNHTIENIPNKSDTDDDIFSNEKENSSEMTKSKSLVGNLHIFTVFPLKNNNEFV